MRMVMKALVSLALCLSWVPSNARAADRPEWLISPELLSRANLGVVWQQTLPVKRGEQFAAVTLLDGRLYFRSDRNYLWALDREKGNVVFSRSIAPPGIPVLGMVAYRDDLISVVGNQLVEYDVATGKERRVSDLELSIMAPPVRNSQFFYVAAGDRRLHVLRANNLVQTFKVAAENESLITTVAADDTLVIFGTAKGDLIAMLPDAPKKLWQFKAPEAVAGPVIPDDGSFYFASKDTNVYRVDMQSPTTVAMAWKFQCEAVLDRPPRVTRDFVYQYAGGRGLTAIRKQTGQAAWALRDGLDLLSEWGSRAYVITGSRTLTVMDNVTGARLYSVNMAPVTAHAANTVDSRIYIAEESGRVMCLRPTQ